MGPTPSMLSPFDAISIVVVGGDDLAFRVCEELTTHRQQVTVLWEADADFEARIAGCGARFVGRRPTHEDALREADVLGAATLMVLTDDDHLNLEVALLARDLNPGIRLVMRQFNRTLGRKIEQNLLNCSVISLSSHSAATYASRAVEPSCFYGVQFPDIDGPLVGFSQRPAQSAGLDGMSVAAAERHLGDRIVAIDGHVVVDPGARVPVAAELTTFGAVRPRGRSVSRPPNTALRFAEHPLPLLRHVWKSIKRSDLVIRRVAIAALLVFVLGAIFFARTLHLDPVSATYFVVSTMTTTGYGDITPSASGAIGELGAIVLMLSGITFTGIFIAILAARVNQAQWVAIQGMRRVRRRGHIVVCGAGNVGSRVIEFLLKLDQVLVVVELEPRPAIVELSRGGRFDMLTGDATLDATLDLCNIPEAHALVALTHSDTANLEVALGARARHPDMPVVMRVQGGTFAASTRRHFGFRRVNSTGALAAPVFAGLSRSPGVRGRVEIGEHEYSIAEALEGPTVAPPLMEGCIPLAAWRNDELVLLSSFVEVQPHDRVLILYPVWRLRAEQRAAETESARPS